MKIDLFTILNLLTVTTFIILIFIISRKRFRTKAEKRFFLTVIFGGLWVILITLMDETTNFEFYRFFTKANFAVATGLAGSVAMFSLHYPDNKKWLTPFKEFLLWIPLIILAILSFSDAFVNPNELRSIETGDFYIYYIGVLVIYFIVVAVYQLVKKFRLSQGLQRQRLKIILAGYLITIVLELSQSIYQNLDESFSLDFARFISFLTIIFPIFATYAIFQHRFLDITLVFKKGVVRSVSFIIIFTVYLLTIFSIKEVANLSESSQTTFLMVAILLIAITIEPIRKFVHKTVDKIFETKDNKKKEAEKRLFIALKSQQTLDNLISSINDIIKELFLVEYVEFLPVEHEFFKTRKETYHYFRNTGRILIPEELPYRLEEAERYFFVHKELKDSEYSALISIGRDELFVGCFALGKRKNNKAYTVEEVREIKKLQDDFTESILNARLYQQAIQRIKI